MLQIILIITCFIFANSATANLETVSDDDLLNLIKQENYVVVLFSKKDCKQCDKYETELLHVREVLVDELSAWVVKVINSQMLRLYTQGKEPAVVFFRQGIPLLYDGEVNEEAMSSMFLANKEPIVKELTDETFEHLTQASSGATTGDWFIMFYSNDCIECQRLGATWEAVGAKLKQGMNVARVNKYTTGSATARRFNVFDVPEFIFFRHGKMYRYQIPKFDVKSFVSFSKDWYRNARGEKVPVPQSPFDDLIQMIVNFLRENPWVMKLTSISIGVVVIVTATSKLRRKTEPQKKEK